MKVCAVSTIQFNPRITPEGFVQHGLVTVEGICQGDSGQVGDCVIYPNHLMMKAVIELVDRPEFIEKFIDTRYPSISAVSSQSQRRDHVANPLTLAEITEYECRASKLSWMGFKYPTWLCQLFAAIFKRRAIKKHRQYIKTIESKKFLERIHRKN